jgi:hypothetical protein
VKRRNERRGAKRMKTMYTSYDLDLIVLSDGHGADLLN